MSLFSDQETSTSQSETNTQTVRGFENVGTAISEVGGDLEVQTTDFGAVQAGSELGQSAIDQAGRSVNTVTAGIVAAQEGALDFARSIGGQAQSTAARAADTLSGAIGKVSDASRSDTTETFRRIALYAAIAVGVVFGLGQLRK